MRSGASHPTEETTSLQGDEGGGGDSSATWAKRKLAKGLSLLLNLGGTAAKSWEPTEAPSICCLPILCSSQEEGEGLPAVRPGPALLLADTFSKAFMKLLLLGSS